MIFGVKNLSGCTLSCQGLSNIDNELEYLIRQDVIFSEASTLALLSRNFASHVQDIQSGLYTLLKNKLSPALISVSTMKKALEEAKNAAARRGYNLAIDNPVDSYKVETNFVSHKDTIYVLTHIPIMKFSSIVDLYRYVNHHQRPIPS